MRAWVYWRAGWVGEVLGGWGGRGWVGGWEGGREGPLLSGGLARC